MCKAIEHMNARISDFSNKKNLTGICKIVYTYTETVKQKTVKLQAKNLQNKTT